MLDLYILLVLQALREGAGACLTDFFLKMSFIGQTDTIFIMMAVIYWCISKRFGTFLLFGWAWNRILNGFLKVTACEYRPWVRDPAIIPDSEAVAAATGYSFPSGHSMSAASVFGGVAVAKHLDTILRIGGCLVLILIMFSRLWLGVHVPQDVIVGAVVGCIVMFAVYKLLPIIDDNKNADIIVAVVSIIIAVAVAIYATFKAYPVDYDATGKVLVEGAKMAKDTFMCVGWNIGFFVSWVIERRFVKFNDGKNIQQRALRLLFGVLSLYAVDLIIGNSINAAIGGALGIIFQCALEMVYVVLIFPLIFNFFEKRSENKAVASN